MNVVFGLSPKVLTGEVLDHVLGQLELSQLVWESDAPYLHHKGGFNGHPWLIRDIAAEMGKRHDVTTGQVLNATAYVARQLFQL